MTPDKPLTVAWISDYPLEWMQDVPEPLRALPRRHPATWEMVLLREFEKDARLRIHVFALRQRIAKNFSFERNGVVYHVLKARTDARVLSFFWLDTFLISKVCRRIRPDLVHAWGMEKGAPIIASRMRYPYLMTVQGLFSWYREHVPMGRYDRFIERLERIYLPRSPVVTTESTFSVNYLKARYPHLRIQQAEHAPNHAFREIRREPQIKPLEFVVVGGLGYRKGTDLLFQALDQLRYEISFKLKIISDPAPAFLQSLQQSASKELWQRVEFRHHILPHQVAKELETPTMLLMPTRADTSPNAVKEAVVAGVPVVATRVGGIPDYVFHEKNGVLFAPNDLPAFVQAIRFACAHPLLGKGQVDPETHAKTRVYLSPERMAENFLKAYDMALTGRRNNS